MSELKGTIEWLQEEPDESDIAPSPNGGRHIPIEKLRPLLDAVNYSTSKYVWEVYNNGRGDYSVAASIELSIVGTTIKPRTAVGVANFRMKSIAPITDWNATAKSMCIKNAAASLAVKFGRDLNLDLSEPVPNENQVEDVSKPKPKADTAIMKMYLKAIETGDQASRIMLENAYEIKTQEDYATT